MGCYTDRCITWEECGAAPQEPVACGARLGDTCAPTEYCDFPEDQCGAADRPGICVERPAACLLIIDPVCGCDGARYNNRCEAAVVGVDESAIADCGINETAPPACGGFIGLECPDDLLCIDDPSDRCDPRRGGADCPGICVPREP